MVASNRLDFMTMPRDSQPPWPLAGPSQQFRGGARAPVISAARPDSWYCEHDPRSCWLLQHDLFWQSGAGRSRGPSQTRRRIGRDSPVKTFRHRTDLTIPSDLGLGLSQRRRGGRTLRRGLARSDGKRITNLRGALRTHTAPLASQSVRYTLHSIQTDEDCTL